MAASALVLMSAVRVSALVLSLSPALRRPASWVSVTLRAVTATTNLPLIPLVTMVTLVLSTIDALLAEPAKVLLLLVPALTLVSLPFARTVNAWNDPMPRLVMTVTLALRTIAALMVFAWVLPCAARPPTLVLSLSAWLVNVPSAPWIPTPAMTTTLVPWTLASMADASSAPAMRLATTATPALKTMCVSMV